MLAAALASTALTGLANAAAFPHVIALSALAGTDGVRVDGVASGDQSAYSISGAGDVNGAVSVA